MTAEQVLANSEHAEALNETQFNHAYEIGTGHTEEKLNVQANNETKARALENSRIKSFSSIEEYSETLPQSEKVAEIFNSGDTSNVNAFAEGFQAAYEMGNSRVGKSYLGTENIAGLTAEQAALAYDMGVADSASKANARIAKNEAIRLLYTREVFQMKITRCLLCRRYQWQKARKSTL